MKLKNRHTNQWFLGLIGVLLLLIASPLLAQEDDMPEDDDIRNHPTSVFLRRAVDSTGIDELIFVDNLSGEDTRIEVYGERYTVLSNAVLFYDQARRRVMLASADGTLIEHPFVQPNLETRRIDWVVSKDGERIAWTITDDDGAGRLSTVTSVADLDGRNNRLVYEDGPTSDGSFALPLAFSRDGSQLYMDTHLDGLDNLIPLAQYIRIFALDLETGETETLPNEESQVCICGADVAEGFFVRLALASTGDRFDVYVYDLDGDVSHEIDALNLTNYIQAGDMLISNDGRYAVYGLLQINNFGTSQQSTRTIFALVDLTTMTQTALTQPITTVVRPVAWTEDNTAIIFTSPNQAGTWKIELSDGRLERIAEAAFLGTLRRS
ncbi:MAG: hypothetical protein RLP44_31245 [Aggregatilineales bacterium]